MSEPSPAPTLDKTFDPAAIEAKWYAYWEGEGLFRPHRPDAEPFTIVNPPPNVTGSLHIGHALDNTLQDVVIRHERLRGKDALWVVGTDHAGIATQMVVERQMEQRQDKRANYTREQFVDKVWEWKRESGGTITQQLRRLGCSMDWSREQFTMSPEFTRAVTKVFVDLYNTVKEDGQRLIYRDKRLVNWDPKLKTAISDLEVETQEIKGSFWHFKYPLADGVKLDSGADHIVVATTRPETMLADMAVAVNVDDPRYKSVIGKHVRLPITGRLVPIVADEHADPELGSGAVKITPGHDFNDFEVGKRAGIAPGDMLNMFDAEARVVQCGGIPDELVGLDRFEARKQVVARMDGLGLLGEVEDRVVATPFGDRGGVVIEPWLTDQWYVDAKTLAQPPIQAVRDGRIEIVPRTWEKTFFNWMENIQPWCVSRQLWWGHRIPAWYGPKIISDFGHGTVENPERQPAHSREVGIEVFVANSPEEALRIACEAYEGREVVEAASEAKAFQLTINGKIGIWQDEDVLDTWFSSALWPFATLGWPEGNEENSVRAEPVEAPTSPSATPQEQNSPSTGSGRTVSLLSKHYPNDLLISGFDILFFWDARMAMQGMHFMGDVPWKRLYLHGLVRAADGQKMSKSKGNVVDPLLLIDQYGADALRFFMCAMESQGRDVKMDEKRVEGYRNFATKLWNAARFCQSNGIGASTTLAAPEASLAVNKWIVGEVVETLAALDQAMADLRFDAAANAIYHFVWDTFCDWYLELVKPTLGDDAAVYPNHATETRAVAGWVLDQILAMLHPFMPFVTEELWSKLGERTAYPLITANWPEPGAGVDATAKGEVEWLIGLIGNLRGAKSELGISPGERLVGFIGQADGDIQNLVNGWFTALGRVGRLEVRFEPAPSGAAMQIGAGDATIIIPLEGIIDIAAERTRLGKALEASQKEARSLEGRLANPAFVEKAKPEAVDKARADFEHHRAEAERLAAALARLG
jgi:valyl-tRNA synthetase